MLHGLDLFSGIGGISLALAPWVKPVAYCDNDRHAQAVLLQRMADGDLPLAPIWDDVSTLQGSMFDAPGSIDIIYGGFPCQDLSVAGSGAGLDGERSGLFFEITRLVGEIRPRFVFLENVPAITVRGLGRVLGAFSDLGYDCRWTVLSAADVGAPHIRKRWWLLAHPQRVRELQPQGGQRPFGGRPGDGGTEVGKPGSEGSAVSGHDGQEEYVADTTLQHRTFNRQEAPIAGRGCQTVADTDGIRGRPWQPPADLRGWQPYADGSRIQDADGQGWSELRTDGPQEAEGTGPQRWATGSGGGTVESIVGGAFDGLPAWVDNRGGLGIGKETKADAIDLLRVLWVGPGAETLFRETRGLECIQAEEILLSFLRQYENDRWGAWAIMESEAPPEEVLREVRREAQAGSASLRRGPIEQYCREHPDALRALSCVVASRGPTAWSSPLWESAVPRSETGIRDRVGRLKGLGNAVVPAQAREAFKVLMGLQG